MIRPILTYQVGSSENPRVLQEETRRVTDFSSEEVRSCIRDLSDTLADFIQKNGNKRGISGLSAPQIGIDLAISVVQTTERLYVLINPVVIGERGKQRLFRIGCFSLFEYRAMVRYNDDVIIEYQDEAGSIHQEEFKGDRSCVMQHELDHLHGWLLFERLPRKEKDLFIPGSEPGDGSFISVTQKYSGLFNDYSDYCSLVEKDAQGNETFLEKIRSCTPSNGSIMELGDGTGTLSVVLGKEGYQVTCTQEDPDMLELDLRIARCNDSPVTFLLRKDLSDRDIFNTIFSKDHFQTLDDGAFLYAIKDISKYCDTLIILVPENPSTSERKVNGVYRSTDEWKALVQQAGLDPFVSNEQEKNHTILTIRKAK
ncbi:MAG: peptide deformylase [Oscillospiraceae bacterium]|nr:peptide deformylase [Oscillospiraceae bacterium]